MKLIKYKYLDFPIKIEDKINILIIENKNLFYNFINSINTCPEEVISIYDDLYNEVMISKNLNIVINYFSLNEYTSKTLIDYTKKNKNAVDGFLLHDRLNSIYNEINAYLNMISMSLPLSIEYDDSVSVESILKCVNAKFSFSEDRINSLIENIKINLEVYNKNYVILINLNLFYTDKEIILINNELILNGITPLYISVVDNGVKNDDNFNITYIDDDLCVF